MEIRNGPARTEVIIRATSPQSVLGEKGKRLREITMIVQKRFGYAEGEIEFFAERMDNRGLSAIAQAESLKAKLLAGVAVRKACNGIVRFIMKSGAKGVEVIVSGKLRGQRAKSMKFISGLMLHSGQPAKEYVDRAVRHVLLRQGVLGIKLRILLDWDPTGKRGPSTPLPDQIIINEPKDEQVIPVMPEPTVAQ